MVISSMVLQIFSAMIERIDELENRLLVDRSSAFPQKPDCMSLKTLEDLAAFQTIDEREFDRVEYVLVDNPFL